MLVGIETVGRRNALLAGALWMMAMMYILGAVLHTHPPTNVNVVSPASIAMVVMIYLYVIGYSMSWGATPWVSSSHPPPLSDLFFPIRPSSNQLTNQSLQVYVAEIFPTRLRAYGVGVAAATQWAFNCLITEITPRAVDAIGWKTFIMFGCFCFGNFLMVFFLIKETKGKSLESMDILFGTVDANQRALDVERMMENEKGIVGAEVQHHELSTE